MKKQRVKNHYWEKYDNNVFPPDYEIFFLKTAKGRRIKIKIIYPDKRKVVKNWYH